MIAAKSTPNFALAHFTECLFTRTVVFIVPREPRKSAERDTLGGRIRRLRVDTKRMSKPKTTDISYHARRGHQDRCPAAASYGAIEHGHQTDRKAGQKEEVSSLPPKPVFGHRARLLAFAGICWHRLWGESVLQEYALRARQKTIACPSFFLDAMTHTYYPRLRRRMAMRAFKTRAFRLPDGREVMIDSCDMDEERMFLSIDGLCTDVSLEGAEQLLGAIRAWVEFERVEVLCPVCGGAACESCAVGFVTRNTARELEEQVSC